MIQEVEDDFQDLIFSKKDGVNGVTLQRAVQEGLLKVVDRFVKSEKLVEALDFQDVHFRVFTVHAQEDVRLFF